MNTSESTLETRPFELESNPPGPMEEEMMLTILEDLSTPPEKRPLQCVTFKMPLPEYFRLKESTRRWKLQYSDVMRIALRKLIPVLESPSGEVLESLEQHRESELARKRRRDEARKRLFVP